MTKWPINRNEHKAAPSPLRHELTGRGAYNVVTDTIGGPNIRLRDNLIQAIAIAVCLFLGAGIGALVVEERVPGALVGAFVGLLVGLFGSGLFLMVYRALMHARGKHD